jgi:hypothetical protein
MLGFCPREIDTNADSGSPREQSLEDRQDCHIPATVLRNR